MGIMGSLGIILFAVLVLLNAARFFLAGRSEKNTYTRTVNDTKFNRATYRSKVG